MKITVLCGGDSPERCVSLISGAMVANALREVGHEVALVDLFLNLDGEAVFTKVPSPVPVMPSVPPDLDALRRLCGRGRGQIGEGVLEACRQGELVFLALHGGIGEDGHLQAILESEGIPFTGAGSRGAMLAMDKALTRRLLIAEGVAMAYGIVLREMPQDACAVGDRLGYPLVVKPCCGGSSLGVSMPSTTEALAEAIREGLRAEGRVLIERRLLGRELSVGILGGRALPPIEMIPKCGFYDYENKYLPSRTQEICPASLTEKERSDLSEAALRAAAILGIDRYCRVDFILSNGIPYCLEVNTLPGMTPTSLLPQEAAAVGISYTELCSRIVKEALS